MALPFAGRVRFRLPSRIRNSTRSLPGIRLRLVLADRIADMPGVTMIRNSGDTGAHDFRFLLRAGAGSAIDRTPDRMFCQVRLDGIVVHGLMPWDIHRVLSRGWGRSCGRDVMLHLPRHKGELDVCWLIVQRAYDCLCRSPAASGTRFSMPEGVHRRLHERRIVGGAVAMRYSELHRAADL